MRDFFFFLLFFPFFFAHPIYIIFALFLSPSPFLYVRNPDPGSLGRLFFPLPSCHRARLLYNREKTSALSSLVNSHRFCAACLVFIFVNMTCTAQQEVWILNLGDLLDTLGSRVSSFPPPPPRYLPSCLSRKVFNIPTFQLCVLVDFYRILRTHALLWLSARQFSRKTKSLRARVRLGPATLTLVGTRYTYNLIGNADISIFRVYTGIVPTLYLSSLLFLFVKHWCNNSYF